MRCQAAADIWSVPASETVPRGIRALEVRSFEVALESRLGAIDPLKRLPRAFEA
jgi:hypothetical protein